MSVYRRAGAETYSYDFRCRGYRFLGNTEKKSRRAAEAVEASKRREAEAEVERLAEQAKIFDIPKTWEVAASRYWHEVGAHHVNRNTTFASLAWLTREIGARTLLSAIDDNMIARLVAKRRLEKRQVGRPENRTGTVGPATVNRTMTEPLRKVLRRAKEVWGSPVKRINWRQHLLAEPQERVREASPGEEEKILAGLDRGYEEAVAFAFRDGCRRMEIIGLKKTAVDFFSRQYSVVGKGGRTRIIPMSDETYAQFWRLKDDPSEFVFTYVAKRTDRRKNIERGERYPLTDAGLRSAMRRAISNGGVTNFRPHDTRHTAATRVLRQSNMRVVQNLLGHSQITTTTKYAHAVAEDIRAALNAVSPAKSPAEPPKGKSSI